ncbi:hypothetical protein OK074_5447 [Actinobacteria bacterium OK074]|nr:hypothetical protein OK074_5447 [Actinobacteria bacterium OK074]
MSEQDVGAVVVAVLVPVVTAAVGVVSLVVQDWRVRRSRVGRRRLVYEEAARQVAFASEWWAAQRLLSEVSEVSGEQAAPEALRDASAVARGWLDDAAARVTAVGSGGGEPELAVSRGRLLLLYRFESPFAKVVRGGFYLALGAMLFVSLSIFSDATEGEPGIGWEVAYLVLFGMLSLLLRFWAVSVDIARRRHVTSPRG